MNSSFLLAGLLHGILIMKQFLQEPDGSVTSVRREHLEQPSRVAGQHGIARTHAQHDVARPQPLHDPPHGRVVVFPPACFTTGFACKAVFSSTSARLPAGISKTTLTKSLARGLCRWDGREFGIASQPPNGDAYLSEPTARTDTKDTYRRDELGLHNLGKCLEHPGQS